VNILFTHPIFPGQFGQLAHALSQEGGHDVVFLYQLGAALGVPYRAVRYAPEREPSPQASALLLASERAVLNGQAAARMAWKLKKDGFEPDVIIGHAGFGELLFLVEVFPGVPIVAYAEYYYRAFGQDVGFDPDMAVSIDDFPRIRMKNAATLACLDIAAAAYTPTVWQQRTHPEAYHAKIQVIHDGIDTNTLKPNPRARLKLESGVVLTSASRVVTFAARGLEEYRGFHKFWPALAAALERDTELCALVVGTDQPTYGPRAAGPSLRERMLQEFPADLSRVHFVPTLDRARYTQMLQISRCHVYLTYPFVPSWSLVEAMACGTPLVVADVPPVREVVGDGCAEMVDFFDIEGLSGAIGEMVKRPRRLSKMRQKARVRAADIFDFQARSWPKLRGLIEAVYD